MMHLVRKDSGLCDGCATCEMLLPGFLSKFCGSLPVSKYRYATDEDVRAAVDSVVDICHKKNITIINKE